MEVAYLSHSCHPGHPSHLSHPIVIPATPVTPAILDTLVTLGTLVFPVTLVSTSTPVIFFFISVTSVILINPCHPGHLIYSCHPTHPTHANSSVRARSSDPRKGNLGELWVVFLILKISNKTVLLYILYQEVVYAWKATENLWKYLQDTYIGSVGGTVKWFLFLVIMPLPLSLLCLHYISPKKSLIRESKGTLLHYKLWKPRVGYSTKFYTGRPRPEVQPLTLLWSFRIPSIDKFYHFHRPSLKVWFLF